jgi:hypothetical protein
MAIKAQALPVIDSMISLIKQGWTQQAMAKDSAGTVVSYHGAEATSFCLIGAYAKAVILRNPPRASQFAVRDALSATIEKQTHNPELSWDDWNDAPERTQQDVLSMLHKAKAILQKEAV